MIAFEKRKPQTNFPLACKKPAFNKVSFFFSPKFFVKPIMFLNFCFSPRANKYAQSSQAKSITAPNLES